MEDGTIRYYEFGEFQLDARKRLLLKNGEQTQISPRIFDLLLVLVQNEGEILSHDDLLDKVWDGAFVEQSNLKKSISALRQILGEHPDERLYVQTVPRRGYSFVAPVRAVEAAADAVYLRETHTEIIVEEIEESDETPGEQVHLSLPSKSQSGFTETLTRYRIAVAAGFILVIAAIGYGIWNYGFKARTQFTFDNIKITWLTSLGNLSGAVISPEGNYVLYASVGSGESSLWLQQTSVGNATQLVPKMRASIYFYGFSPDGNYVHYTVDNNPDSSQNGFFRIPLLGGTPQRMTGNAHTASPDGSRLVYSTRVGDQTSVATSKADGTDARPVATFGNEYRIWDMRWSPDGKTVLLALRKFTADKIVHYVAEYPLDGGTEKIVVPEMEKQITSAIWVPDKSSLLLCLREVNAEIRQIWQYFPATGEFKRVTNDYSSYYSLTMTRDGKSIVTTSPNRLVSIWTADDDKFDFKQMTSGASHIDKVGWMADGKLAFSAVNNGAEAVYMMNADGKDQRQVTKGEDGIWLVPRVSVDGRSILFNSSRTGRKQLWRSDADGRNQAYLTSVDDLLIFDGKLLADNQTVLFRAEGRGHSLQLYEKLPDGMVKVVTDFETGTWDLSPDEKRLAYLAVDKSDGKGRIFIRDLHGGEPLLSFDVRVSGDIRWTRDGKSLTYTVDTPDAVEPYIHPADGGAVRLIAKFPGERILSFDWSFDGKHLAVVRGKLLTDAVMITNEVAKK